MKLKDFLENPAGKGDSSLNRAALRNLLDNKYENLIKNKGDKIKLTIYHQLGDIYYIHMVFPSETARENTYDVVVCFSPDPDIKGQHMSLLHTHNVTFFCNAPSFAYTFAKVYRNNGLFIESLRHKFPKEIYANDPEIRNRYGIVNYDKYLYFGCKYIYESHIVNKSTLGLRSVLYTPQALDLKVRNLDRIMIDYKKAKNKLDKDRKDSVQQKVDKAYRHKHPVKAGIKEIKKHKAIKSVATKSAIKKHKPKN